MIGKIIKHYKIIEKLGERGMGVIYLAEDIKLKRQVAIKFLPKHIASNNDQHERFEIEARVAAGLRSRRCDEVHRYNKWDFQKSLKKCVWSLVVRAHEGGQSVLGAVLGGTVGSVRGSGSQLPPAKRVA